MNTNISLFKVHMPKSVNKPLLKVLHSGFIGQGPKVEEFENILAKFLDNKNILTVNSGTSALQLALRLANVTIGDEVISTPMTCSATNEPILATGAKIIWADIIPNNGLIDPKSVIKKITKKTKAVMCVDWGGTPCDLDELLKITKKYGIKLIEDAAHGFGSKYKNKSVGSISDFTCFSLQAIKHITTVDGGILTTLNKKDFQRGKLLRWYGIDREAKVIGDSRIDTDIPNWGYKFHMNDVNATIGITQMEYISEILNKHRCNAHYYFKNINNKFYQHPITNWSQISSFWLYTLILPTPEKRVKFAEYMKNNGIATSRVHRRNDTYLTFPKSKENLPGVTYFYDREECIPVHWSLTNIDLKKIVKFCNEFSNKN
ncbi:MAG: DegT/DnrJ/EryC1/StrS family aminotransferase [bacterium]|nr:DegT/DnrJ/EryC1/StrS family aminotransferase [bacterium]